MTSLELPAGVREATVDDVEDILRLIHGLAEYERDPDSVVNTPELLRQWLFGADPVASCLVAEVDGRVAGIALWFRSYSTWTGVPGLYLEDLFVEPEHRGRGLGRALFAALARIAVARGYARFEWAVLDWNQPAIDFYESLGGRPLKDWKTYRLQGAALAALAH